MPRSFALFIALTVLSAGIVSAACAMVYRLTPQHRRGQQVRWLAAWFIKGLALPLLLWMIMNIGVSWNLQPFMPAIQAAKIAGDPWIFEFLGYVGCGFFIVGSYWTALTLAWVLIRASKGLEGDARADFKALCLTSLIGMILPAAGITFLGGWAIIGLAATSMLAPIAGYAPSILRTQKLPPMYARAVAKMKFGKYSEAEWVIIQELEKCEDDFEGWMMLADLYANQFNNMVEAEQTILEICDQPRTTPSQVSIALHRLADWYLKISQDPDAARRALQTICERMPGTHLARMAQLRLNQLPQTVQDLREQQTASPIPLPALGDQLDEPAPLEMEMDRQKAAEMANACARKLELDPNNVQAREKFARILTERLYKPDLGIEQITLLLNMPEQSEAKRAEWLGTIAAWHIRYKQDPDTGRNVLERVIREFPNSPQALAARRRIRLIDTELRGKASA
jgi:hypothetical protein